MELPTSAVIGILVTSLVLAIILAFFLLGIQLSPIEATSTFTEGCITHCNEIQETARESGRSLAVIAVERAEELRGSRFIRACEILHPDTTGLPWQCWNRGCCQFELPPP